MYSPRRRKIWFFLRLQHSLKCKTYKKKNILPQTRLWTFTSNYFHKTKKAVLRKRPNLLEKFEIRLELIMSKSRGKHTINWNSWWIKWKLIQIRKSKFEVHTIRCLRNSTWNLIDLRGTIFKKFRTLTEWDTHSFIICLDFFFYS